MTNLKVLEQKTDVTLTLKEFTDRAEHFEGVMLVALNKDGSQFMATSTMSAMQKCFLGAFVQSYINHWFRHEDQK